MTKKYQLFIQNNLLLIWEMAAVCLQHAELQCFTSKVFTLNYLMFRQACCLIFKRIGVFPLQDLPNAEGHSGPLLLVLFRFSFFSPFFPILITPEIVFISSPF